MRFPSASAFVLALLLAGCWSARRGPAPPDLSGQNSEIAETAQRLELVGETMSSELQALQKLQTGFFDAPEGAWKAPFPLDQFKHAAMSCLNEPFTDVLPDPALQKVAQRLRISCAVPAAGVLDAALERLPGRRSFAEEKLQQIDDVRLVRSELQGRLRQLPAITRRTRNYLAARRAEARQVEDDAQRRRSEYDRKAYQETMGRLAQHRARLDELEAAIDEVERSIPRWSGEVGGLIDALYKRLSRLGREPR